MKYSIQLYIPTGDCDEDRYIIIDNENMDVDGEHYSLEDAQKIVDEYNEQNPFTEWIESDNVICVATNMYQTQCSQYSINFTKKELFNYFTREYYGS